MENQIPRFFVYIIESPSAIDLYHHRSEGRLLEHAANLDGIPCVIRTTIDPEAFIAAFRVGLPEAMAEYPDHVPILHISAHGSRDGIQLSNGKIVPWKILRILLLPINKSLQGLLILCMSACEGYSACVMAMTPENEPAPYFALIANYGTPTWSDTAVAYAAFYHLISKGKLLADTIQGMRSASGDDKWQFETAQTSQKDFLAYLNKVDLTQSQHQLEEVAQEEIPPEAKALENDCGKT